VELNQIRHYLWEIIKVFIPVLITVGVMIFIDWQNKKRWLNEGYLKRKIDLELKIKEMLLRINLQLNKFPSIDELSIINNKTEFNTNDLKFLENLNTIFMDKIEPSIKDISSVSCFVKKDLKTEYDINLLLEEYKTFDLSVSTFQKYYNEFINLKTIYSINEFEINSHIDITTPYIHEFVKCIFNTKNELKILLETFNKIKI
jgi:hypothetical protein